MEVFACFLTMAAEQHGVLLPTSSPELKPLNLCSTAALEPPMFHVQDEKRGLSTPQPELMR